MHFTLRIRSKILTDRVLPPHFFLPQRFFIPTPGLCPTLSLFPPGIYLPYCISPQVHPPKKDGWAFLVPLNQLYLCFYLGGVSDSRSARPADQSHGSGIWYNSSAQNCPNHPSHFRSLQGCTLQCSGCRELNPDAC